jgi:hypothetical protein
VNILDPSQPGFSTQLLFPAWNLSAQRAFIGRFHES